MNLGSRVAFMKILFVCLGNIYRSPVAEALFKKFKPEIDVDSAGVHPPLFPISEDARKYLARENAEQYLKKVPESIDNKQLEEYDLIVTMESEHKEAVLSKCPECENRTVVWNIQDPYSLPPERTEEIFRKIKDMVAELANAS